MEVPHASSNPMHVKICACSGAANLLLRRRNCEAQIIVTPIVLPHPVALAAGEAKRETQVTPSSS
jgi:hypothetical protein